MYLCIGVLLTLITKFRKGSSYNAPKNRNDKKYQTKIYVKSFLHVVLIKTICILHKKFHQLLIVNLILI